jgi:hypothetical protein
LKPLWRAIELIKAEVSLRSSGTSNNNKKKTMIVLAGRSRRMAVESFRNELGGMMNDASAGSGSTTTTTVTMTTTVMNASVPKTLGDMGAALVLNNVNASLLVLQARNDDE